MPGCGAPGDRRSPALVLERNCGDTAMAIFYDPEVVKTARKAGRAPRFPVRLGGKTDHHTGHPGHRVTVLATADNYMHEFPQLSGEPARYRLGDVVSLRCASIDIVVASER